MTGECRIKCHAKPGAFSDEFVVRISIVDSQGQDVQAESLAYSDSIELHGQPSAIGEHDATLRVYQLGQRDSLVSVVLPQPTFQNGPSVIVRQTNLV